MQEGMQGHQHRAERIEVLLQEVSTFSDPHVSEVIEELVQSLLDMYGEGLKRLLRTYTPDRSIESCVSQAVYQRRPDWIIIVASRVASSRHQDAYRPGSG